jgi:hypothetical protein
LLAAAVDGWRYWAALSDSWFWCFHLRPTLYSRSPIYSLSSLVFWFESVLASNSRRLRMTENDLWWPLDRKTWAILRTNQQISFHPVGNLGHWMIELGPIPILIEYSDMVFTVCQT